MYPNRVHLRVPLKGSKRLCRVEGIRVHVPKSLRVQSTQ